MYLLKKTFFTKLLILLLLVMGLWFSTVPVSAAINDQIHFQGKVVNSDGTNVTNGDYSFTFTIYDASTAGTNLWTETKTITVTDGIFATDLGSVTDLPGSINFNTDSLYLGVEFDGDGEMEPRIRFTAVPYAFNAEKVAGLTVTETTGTLTIPAATIAFSGANDVTFTSTGATTVTLPTTGTLATLAGAETFSNKTIASGGLAIASTGWIGIGSSAGKVTFTDDTTDTIAFENANVGIGTTTIGSRFEVVGASNNANVAQFSGDRPDSNINMYFKHTSAASVDNSARLTFQLNTDAQSRTAFEYISGFTDIADATRTSYAYFAATDNGSYGNRMALVGSNLGVGTIVPSARLDINGTASSSSTLSFRGTTDPRINILNGEDFSFATSVGGNAGLTERLTLLNNGNVGIGTSTPLSRLELATGQLFLPDGTNSVPALAGRSADSRSTGIRWEGNIALLSSGGYDFLSWGIGTGEVGILRHMRVNSFLDLLNGGKIISSGQDIEITPALTYNTLITRGNVGINTTNASSFGLEIAGDIGPSSNDTYSFGSDTRRWANVHVTELCLSGDCQTAWPSGSGGGSNWRYNLGAFSPVNDTVDLLVGANATASAKFAVLNINNGTPIASVSSGLSGNSLFLTADGTLSTTRRRNLTLGNSSSYNTTGNVLINPNGVGRVGIGNSTPDGYLTVGSDADPADAHGDLNIWTTSDLTEDTGGTGQISGLWIVRYGNPSSTFTGTLEGIDSTAAVKLGNVQNFNNLKGVAGASVHGGSGTVSEAEGTAGWVINASTGTITDGKALMAYNGVNTGGGTFTNNYGLYVQNMTGGANDYGIYIAGADTYALWADAGDVRVDGRAGIWASPTTTTLLNVGGNANAFSGAGGFAFGVYNDMVVSSSVTTAAVGVLSQINTQAASFTLADAISMESDSPSLGAGSAITRAYGIYINTQDVTNVGTGYGVYQVGAADINYFAGNVGIGTTTVSNFNLEIAGSIGPEANNTRTLGSSSKRWSSVHTTQLCLSGDCQTAWPSGSGGGSNWRYNLGAFSPVNDTVDLLVGANTTASAKFAVLNVNNGTPVASISSGVSGTSAFLSADGALSATRRMNLTIGNSTSYNTTGNVLINPNGTGNVGIGTAATTAKLTVLSGDTTRALQVVGDSVTTGEVIDISADGLTTGYAMNLSSTSNNLSSGGLVDLDWTPSAVATASGDLFKIRLGAHADTTGNLLALYDSDSTIFLASTVKITSAVPHEFTATGDVSIAYDLVFTNQTASEIQSYGPLTIKSGEVYENLDLTLDPSGTGGVVVADGSDIKVYADQKMIFDVDDSSDSYIQFDNTNNRVEVFADNSERFRFTASGNNESNGSVTTTLSDLAENYPTMNEALQPGEVVMIVEQGSDAPAAALVDIADNEHRQQVLGVVSSKPGIVLGGSSFLSDICEASTASDSGKLLQRSALLQTEYKQLKLTEFEASKPTATNSAFLQSQLETQIASDLETLSSEELESELPATTIKTVDDRLNSCDAVKQVPVALAGRVPVKFDSSQGAVKPGDLLSVSAKEPGAVTKATTAGWVLGKALAASTYDSDTVMMFVNITWYGGGSTIASLGQVLGTSDVSLSPELSELLSVSTLNNKQFIVSSADMSVFGTLTAHTLAATDKILTGMLSIGGEDNEITTVDGSVLKLQTGFGAGNIEAFNKKLVFTSEGGVIAEDQITAKRFAASDDARGSVYATTNKIRVDKQWKTAPASITLTPEYRADVWVSDITKDGFYINAEPLSASKKVYWWAVW